MIRVGLVFERDTAQCIIHRRKPIALVNEGDLLPRPLHVAHLGVTGGQSRPDPRRRTRGQFQRLGGGSIFSHHV